MMERRELMDKIKLDTSIQFPFLKINELVTYSEVKKPSGIAYILLVLINESKDKRVTLSNVLENFGVPKNLQYIFSDELEKLIQQDILTCEGFYKNEFENYNIGYFEFTIKGKKFFADESIPTGINKQTKIGVFYNIAKNELSLSINQDLEPKPLMDCALSPNFISSFKCRKDVENYLNLHKGEKGVGIKKEEVITEVETIGEIENWTAKYECTIELTKDSLSIKFADEVLQKFAEKYYDSNIINASILYKNKFKFESKYTEHISLVNFPDGKIDGLFIPKEIGNILKKKSRLFLTKGNYNAIASSVLSCVSPKAIEKIDNYIEFVHVDLSGSVFGYVPATFDFKNSKFGLITLPLLLRLKVGNDELKEAIRTLFDDKRDYSIENFKLLAKLTDITKDYDFAYSLMDGYMSENRESNIIKLNEMKSVAVINSFILSKHKELTSLNYFAYIAETNESNLDTCLKIAQSVPKYLGIPEEESLKTIFSAGKQFSNKANTFNILASHGYSKEAVCSYVNPVPEVLKTKIADSEILLNLLNFNDKLNLLQNLTGIYDYKSFSFDEESLDINIFKKQYGTAFSLFKSIQFFKNENIDLFNKYDGFMKVFGLINDNINMVENASKNPGDIKIELIEKKIASGLYQFVFVNLSAKLETILKTKYHLEGKLSVMLSNTRKTGVIDKDIVKDLNDFRKNRNASIHPENKNTDFTPDDLRRWTKEIFDLGRNDI